MATTVTLKPNAIDISGSTSGTTTLQATAVAGTTTLTLPAATDTLVGKATTDTLTNKTLTGAVMNGTLGATTPSTASVTTLTTSSTVTHSGGTANGVAYLDGSKALTTGSALVFDGTNLGVGVTPSAWSLGKAIELNSLGSGLWSSGARNIRLSNNVIYTGGAYKYATTGFASLLTMGDDSTLTFAQAASGTAGNSISFTSPLTLDASGNLLVGTTTKNSDGKISISASSASNQGMTIKETSATNDIYYILFQNSTGGTAGRIEHTGATTVSYTSGSDVRLKTNIVDAGSAKEKIEAIKIREFDWKTGEHQKFGVIAQELIEVAPEAVCAAKTEDDYWGVDYSKLIPSLIKYVQEQQALITQLQSDVAALKGASA